MTLPRVLLIDDDCSFGLLMTAKLEGDFEILVVHEAEQVLPTIVRFDPHAVLLDIEMEEEDTGLKLLAEIQSMTTPPAVIMLTRDKSPETGRMAGALGAYRYLAKTVELSEIRNSVYQALAEAPIPQSFQLAGDEADQIPGLLAVSDTMKALMARVKRVARSRATVLIHGETGVGKGVLARAINTLSERRGPFVRCDGTTMPRELMHAELVGYRKGAFTGANCDYDGHFAAADGGTIFIDEIGEATLEMQSALLHAVDTGEVTPLGAAGQTRSCDVRVIAASNQNLDELVRRRLFKPDLLARLNVYPIEVPPLRQRRDDIVPLATYYLNQFVSEEGRSPMKLSPAVQVYLRQNDWPDNVRGIENTMRRAVIDSPGPVVELTDIIDSSRDAGQGLVRYADLEEQVQRNYLCMVLAATNGHVAEAAEISGVTRKTLYVWMERHDLRVDDFRNGVGVSP